MGTQFSKEVVIRHGIFWYYAMEDQPTTNKDTGLVEMKPGLVQRVANQNETVTLTNEADFRRGVEHHAFWTEDELAAAKAPVGVVVTPAEAAAAVDAPEPALVSQTAGHEPAGDGDEDVEDPMDQDVASMDDDDLRDWLTGTGAFDGQRKPNQNEVVQVVGSDKDLAARMLAAERMTREQPRSQIEQKLTALQEGGE